jgi:hypothetical protein
MGFTNSEGKSFAPILNYGGGKVLITPEFGISKCD